MNLSCPFVRRSSLGRRSSVAQALELRRQRRPRARGVCEFAVAVIAATLLAPGLAPCEGRGPVQMRVLRRGRFVTSVGARPYRIASHRGQQEDMITAHFRGTKGDIRCPRISWRTPDVTLQSASGHGWAASRAFAMRGGVDFNTFALGGAVPLWQQIWLFSRFLRG